MKPNVIVTGSGWFIGLALVNKVAGCLDRYQSFIALIESGQRRIDVVDFFTGRGHLI